MWSQLLLSVDWLINEAADLLLLAENSNILELLLCP